MVMWFNNSILFGSLENVTLVLTNQHSRPKRSVLYSLYSPNSPFFIKKLFLKAAHYITHRTTLKLREYKRREIIKVSRRQAGNITSLHSMKAKCWRRSSLPARLWGVVINWMFHWGETPEGPPYPARSRPLWTFCNAALKDMLLN